MCGPAGSDGGSLLALHVHLMAPTSYLSAQQ